MYIIYSVYYLIVIIYKSEYVKFQLFKFKEYAEGKFLNA